MLGSGPHQTGPHQIELAGFQRQDNFLNLERERDRDKHREGSVHTTHTTKSHSRVRSHISQKQDDNKTLQQEIDDLKRNYVVCNRGVPLLVQILVMKGTTIIGKGQELHQVKPFLMRKSTTIKEDTKVRPVKA